jgi:hypothetical protein
MSRYVRVELAVDVAAADQLRAALARLGLDATAAEIPGGLMLTGSLECAGEPVDLRLPAGALGAVEDFGLRRDRGRWQLVCGEHDRALLAERLLGPLTQLLAADRVAAAAEAAGLGVETVREADGTVRLRVRPA